MKRLTLKHGYHDARIRAVRYDRADLVIDVDLCGCCNPTQGTATSSLLGVRDFDQVATALEAARRENVPRGYVDEIIAVIRDDRRGFLLDLATADAVHVDARGLHEA